MGHFVTFRTYVKDGVLYVEEYCNLYHDDFVVIFTSTNHRAKGKGLFENERNSPKSLFRLLRYLYRVLPNDEFRRYIDESYYDLFYWFEDTTGSVRKCYFRMMKIVDQNN